MCVFIFAADPGQKKDTPAAPSSSNEIMELIPFKWRIDKSGVLMIKPHYAYAQKESFGPILRGITVSGKGAVSYEWDDILDIMKSSGPLGLINYMFSGPLDMASISDAETIFQKLRLGTSDRAVIERAGKKIDSSITPPIARRETLHRLLAVRLCGTRGLKKAEKALSQICADENRDIFLRKAAENSLTMIRGEGPVFNKKIQSSESLLVFLPGAASIVISAAPGSFPVWKRPGFVCAQAGHSSMRRMAERIGKDKLSVCDLSYGQAASQSVLYTGYELAWIFGNFRISRIIAGLTFTPERDEPEITVAAEGRFFPEQFLKRHPYVPHSKKGGYYIFESNSEYRLFISQKTAVVAHVTDVKDIRPDNSLERKADNMEQSGIGGPGLNIVIADCGTCSSLLREVPAGGQLSFKDDIVSAQLNVTYNRGVSISAGITAASQEKAVKYCKYFQGIKLKAGNMLKTVLGAQQDPVSKYVLQGLENSSVTREKSRVKIELSVSAAPEEIAGCLASAFLQMRNYDR